VERLAAIVQGERVDPVRRVRRKVIKRERATMPARVRYHFFGELAPVESLALRLRNALERLRMRGGDEFLARRRGATIRHEVLGESGNVPQPGALLRPQPRDGGRDQVAAGSKRSANGSFP